MIDPDKDQLAAFQNADADAPITMVNLLQFKPQASYPAGHDGDDRSEARSGAEAYALYGKVAAQHIQRVGGEIISAGPVQQGFIGAGDDIAWDMVAIVRYPSRRAFLDMIGNPNYQAATVHRTAGLKRTVLLQCPG